jgi:hypothetical protein
MNRHFLLSPVAILALIAASPLAMSPVWATSFISRPLPETTQKTPTLVRGKIGSSYSDWVKMPEGGRRIYTFYELQVTEVFKGDPKPGKSIQIRELGGEKDGIGLQIAGTAQFSPGEDVVVTLGEKNPDGTYDLRGLMTGKFGIEKDPSGNEILVGATGDDADSAPADHHGPWTLSEFRKMVASQSGTSHSETKAEGPAGAVRGSVTPAPSVSASASPGASFSPAPQLQTERDQGAAQPAETGFKWIYLGAAILLIGGWMVGRGTRRKK